MTDSPSPSDLTEDESRRFRLLVEMAAAGALHHMSEEKLRRLIRNSGEFQAGLNALIQKCAAEQFADEEVPSTYGYPPSHKLRPIAEQWEVLRNIFPQSGFDSIDVCAAMRQLPSKAEGYFVLPRHHALAATYNEALLIILRKLAETRAGKFRSLLLYGQIGPQELCEAVRKKKFFEKRAHEQREHKLIVMPAQFGLLHRGRSVRRAREVMEDEVGLGAFEVGVMLLTHPERLTGLNDLYIDCAGDDCGGGSFVESPYFYFDGSTLVFCSSHKGCVGRLSDRYGSASVFGSLALEE